MTRPMLLFAVPAALVWCTVGCVIAVVAAHASMHVDVPIDGLTAGIGVALDRLFHADPGGAVEALAAILRS